MLIKLSFVFSSSAKEENRLPKLIFDCSKILFTSLALPNELSLFLYKSVNFLTRRILASSFILYSSFSS